VFDKYSKGKLVDFLAGWLVYKWRHCSAGQFLYNFGIGGWNHLHSCEQSVMFQTSKVTQQRQVIQIEVELSH